MTHPNPTPSPDPYLMWLVSQPRVLDVLDALSTQPHTIQDLRGTLHATRRQLARALRAAAAYGALRPEHGGSWDHLSNSTTAIGLTPTGREMVQRLSHLAEWEAMYEYLYRLWGK